MAKHRIIRVDYSVASYLPPFKVMDAIHRSVSKVNFHPYEGYAEICKAIASYCGVREENILVTNGGDEAIMLITTKFGPKVLIPTPTYGEYEYIAKSRDYSITKRNCLSDSGEYRICYTKKDLGWATLAWICNPNNPTGTLIPKKDIMGIINGTDAMVVVDEAYYEFSGQTVAKEVDNHRNLIVLRTFSKGFGIAGLRLGYIIAHPSIIKMFSKYNQEYNVNRVARAAGIAALKSRRHYQRRIFEAKKRRDNFQKFAESIGVHAFKSNGGFIFLKFSDMREADYVYGRFLDEGIITFISTDAEFSGLEGPYMRLALSNTINMKVIQRSLARIISEYRSQ